MLSWSAYALVLVCLLSSGCDSKSANNAAGANGKGGNPSGGAPGASQGPSSFRTVTNVEAVTVSRGAVASYQTANGHLEARERANVFARISELCLEVLVEENDIVEAGTPMARLNSDRLRNALITAQANEERAIQREREAKIDFDKATDDHARLLKVVEEGLEGQFIAKDEIDRARVAAEKAGALWLGSKADLKSAQANTANASLDLAHCEVKSPISGVVAIRRVEPNDLVKVDQELFQVVELDSLRMKVELPETSVALLRNPERNPDRSVNLSTTQAVLLAGTAYPSARFVGYVEIVSPVITDPTRGMLGVILRVVQPHDATDAEFAPLLTQFPPTEREAVLRTARRAAKPETGTAPIRLRPGNFLEASIVTSFKRDSLVLPTAAVIGGGVFVIVEPETQPIAKPETNGAPARPSAAIPTSAGAADAAPTAAAPAGAAPGASKGKSGDGSKTGDRGGRPGTDAPSLTVRRVELAGHLGISSEGYTELLESAGIKAGDRIVFRGQELLRDGAPVRVVQTPTR